MDLLPSDVHRILASLSEYGFVERNPRTKMYRLGVAVMKLGLTALQRNELRDAARPLLQRLSEQTSATAHMAIFDRRDLEIFLAEQIDCSADPVFKPRYGTIAGHSTALGKTILAGIGPEMALQFLNKTGFGGAELPRLQAELERTALRGYAIDREESTPGACCVGAPVRDWSGATVGAISISMDAARFYASWEPDLAASVRSTALELSSFIGYRNTAVSR